MDHYQKKEKNYTKWNQEIWLSVEKEISLFQIKVTDCMLQLGDFKKRNVEDYKVQPCLDDDVILGDQFYLENIRPQCVKKGYLPKKIPTPEDLSEYEDSDSDSDSASDENQQNITQVKSQTKGKQNKTKEKKGGKKGGKNSKGGKSNQQQMKMKIVQDNFRKDIEMVMNSHSLERMQVQFGLKHKKLEVKLISFFYVAYYIRKNKEHKKIQESEIFQLINILIKIVRIFDGFQGKSFLASDKKKDQMVEVSQTLILDLKMCIKGLKQYYRYSNRKIIINYPKLVYYTNYDKFFPTLDIKPYPSQIQFIQAVKKAFNEKGSIANPTLILYRTMIGSGKTSAAIALSNLVVESKMVDQKNSNIQLVYSCLIGSVRVQVGRYAYNKSQKFALAAMERSIKNENYYYPRIINSYSCRNEKIVDLVISDLDCTYEMLNYHDETPFEKDIFDYQRKERKKAVNVGKFDRENIILFIDQPTAFCKSVDSVATQKLFDILANYPPKLVILASATMPDAAMLPKTIELISKKNPGLQVFQIESKQFQIGCQFCSFKGEVIFPHTNLKNKAQLQNIVKLLQKNPFLLRLYTGPSLFFLLKRCEEVGIKNLPKIDLLPEVRQGDIIKATFRILKLLLKQNDQTIAEVCRLAADETNLDYKIEDEKSDSDDDFNFLPDKKKQEEMQEQKQEDKKDFVDFKRLLKSDAYKFLGGCLIGTENPLEFARKIFDKWVRKIKPIKRLMQKYHKSLQQLQKQIKLIIDDKQKRQENKTKQISKLQSQRQALIQFPVKKRINTIDHYKKYCKNKESTHLSMLIKPVPLQSVGEELLQEVDDFVLKLLFCGVALYMEKGLSPKYLDKVEELASQNYLAFIITDQSLCYGTNFPISNVILCDELAKNLNMNQMFQLIGRAGRVGQSWTARAFLEPHGLTMLNEYIHNQNKAVSQQAKVFEQLAQRHLDNPELTLRSTISQINYVDIQNPDERIQVEIKKKKKQDMHIFKNVVLVPFNKDGKVLCKKIPYKTLNYYQLPQSQINYQDIPTKPNSQGQPIIDVQFFYKKQPEFIRQLLNKTVERILKTNQLDIPLANQINQFKPKVYQQFYNPKSNTFTVLFRCPDDIKLPKQSQFVYHTLQGNNQIGVHFDEKDKERLQQFCNKAKQIYPTIVSNPTGVLQGDVANLFKTHQQMMHKQKTKFYREIYQYHLNQVKEEYEGIIEKVSEKDALQCRQQSLVALIAVHRGDFVNINHQRFHIDFHVRDIWNVVLRQIEKK